MTYFCTEINLSLQHFDGMSSISFDAFGSLSTGKSSTSDHSEVESKLKSKLFTEENHTEGRKTPVPSCVRLPKTKSARNSAVAPSGKNVARVVTAESW